MSGNDVAIDIGAAAQLACLLEATAPKPGNVSPGVRFGDTTYEDFLASAAAIGPALGSASRPLGATILLAIQTTRRWTTANTNLGIVLLLAPLARAAAIAGEQTDSRVLDVRSLRTALSRVLAETTIDDARTAYAAIRLASPGGLGPSASQDVAGEPTITLTAAMRLAADRDGIANEYATDFHATFEIGAPTLRAARTAGLDWNDAVVETFLTLLASSPDTHIARRAGLARAEDTTRRARAVLELGGVRSPDGRAAIADLHYALRDPHNLTNPGTTADITAAAIFVDLLTGGWHCAKRRSQCSIAVSIAYRSRRTTWSSRRRTSSRSPAIAARRCTATTTACASSSKARSTLKAGTCSTSSRSSASCASCATRFDHKVLLAVENPHLQIAEQGDSVTVAYDNKPRYVFPKRDCALLPVPNTTVEMLAELLTGQLQASVVAGRRQIHLGDRDGGRGELRPVGDVPTSSLAGIGVRVRGQSPIAEHRLLEF